MRRPLQGGHSAYRNPGYQPPQSYLTAARFSRGPTVSFEDPFNNYPTVKESSLQEDPNPPLDAFDQQLLAEQTQEHQYQATEGRARISLPSRTPGSGIHYDQGQAIRDDLHNSQISKSSPSSFGPATSPTVSVLQNRRTAPLRDPVKGVYGGRLSHGVLGYHQEQVEVTSQAQQNVNQRIDLSHAPPVVQGIRLVPRSTLPDQLGSIFKYEIFNAVQSKCYTTAFDTDDNLVLSAPTGSGKTTIMELAICRLIKNSKRQDYKVVYMAPTKSLCAERQDDWSKRFKSLGIDSAALTGDTEYNDLRRVQEAHIIITTPEKWDSVTRKWRDNQKLMRLIRLFLIDEVHILKDPRGATLEAVVSRMKSTGVHVRFIALSATVPNSDDIATWLGRTASTPDVAAQREVFDESFRPVKLEKHVYGFQGGNNDFSFDMTLMNQVTDCISRHSDGKPTMIFCMTRKSAARTAQTLARYWNQSPAQCKPWPASKSTVAVSDAELAKLAPAAVSFHHAGLSQEDRKSVEQGFLRGDMKVICSTSTLSVGVNLPCYLVIIQGTVTWTAQGAQEYSDLEILQMLGRAGRPQFERSACAVILTREEKTAKYQKMVSGQELLESTLHRNLIEHLNAEIGLGTVYDIESAKRWLNSTFFRVRLRRNPKHYQLEERLPLDEDELIQELCEKDIGLLEEPGFVDRTDKLRCTELGDAMARYYVNYNTMKTFTSIQPRAKISEILSTLCQAVEFFDARMKAGEKSYYKELNKANDIRYPINVDIALAAHKVSLIIQAELANVPQPAGPNFNKLHVQHSTDISVVFGHAKRLIRCIIDCQLYLKDAVSTRNALELASSIPAKAWDSTPNQLKQIPGVGPVLMRKLASKGIKSVDAVINAAPERLALVMGKQQQAGYALLKKLESFPNLMISVREMGREVRPGQGVKIKLKCDVGFLNENKPVKFGMIPIYVCFLAEDSQGNLVDFRRFGAKKLHNGEEIRLTAHILEPTDWIRCHVMVDELAGTHKYAELSIKGVPANFFPQQSASTGESRRTGFASARIKRDEDEQIFDNDELEDEDFLNAAPGNGNAVEVVEDIDTILAEAESKQLTKRSRIMRTCDLTQMSGVDDTDFIEPVQLDNGRWTCQHLCKKKEVDCKHVCCRDGVKHPRRRPNPKKEIESSVIDKKQRKITTMAPPTSQSSQASSSKGLEALHQSTPSLQPSQSMRPDPALPNQARKRKQLEVNSSDSTSRDSEISAQPEKRAKTHSNSATNGGQMMLDEVYDIDVMYLDAALPKPDQCDWNISMSSSRTLGDVVSNESLVHDRVNASFDDDFDADFDMDDIIGKQPPLDHVSRADVETDTSKDLFITGESSSPVKATLDSAHRPSIEDSLETPSVCEELQKPSDGCSVPRVGVSETRSNAGAPIQVALPSSTLIEAHDEVEVSVSAANQEADSEREKKVWEEDQKRRWEGLEPWMYEMYHNLVELVD